jgi:hypothetical protein
VSDSENHITNLWDSGEGHFSNQDNLYKSLFSESKVFLESVNSVLEIGPGNGNFADFVLQEIKGLKSYSFLDIPKGINILKERFGSRCEYVQSSNYQELNSFDLVISNNCLSETPAYYREFLFKNVITSSRYLYLVDGDNNIPNYRTHIKKTLCDNGEILIFKPNVYLCSDFFLWRNHGL